MNPILFPAGTQAGGFGSHGLGNIADAASCIVKEQLNGEYTAALTLPVDSIRYGDLRGDCLVLIKPNPEDDPQPFRVVKFSRPLRGLVTAYLQHWSYDLSGYPVRPFTAGTAAEAISLLGSYQVLDCPFTFSTDLESIGSMAVTVPSSTRALMGSQNNQILRSFGGEWRFAGTQVQLLTRRGADRGFSVRYGKNMVDLKQEEDCAVYSAILPFWSDSRGTLVEGSTIRNPGTPPVVRMLPLDLSGNFTAAPSVSELDQAAQRWVERNNPWVPKVNIQAQLAMIAQGMEPGRPAGLEDLRLGDTVRVHYERLGVDATARVIEAQYDALAEKFVKIQIGDPKITVADTVVDNRKEAQSAGGSARAAGYAAAAAQATADAAKFDIDTFLYNLHYGTVSANFIATNMISLQGNGAAIVFGYNNYRPKTTTVATPGGGSTDLTYLGI